MTQEYDQPDGPFFQLFTQEFLLDRTSSATRLGLFRLISLQAGCREAALFLSFLGSLKVVLSILGVIISVG
jgi:hypothetical protein